MRIELLIVARGRVQGVGFRAAAKHLANRLHLQGYARNLADGSVEIYAQGKKDTLDQFLVLLQKEFPSDFIQHIAIDFREISQTHSEFKILR
jgi:acylphosphatase